MKKLLSVVSLLIIFVVPAFARRGEEGHGRDDNRPQHHRPERPEHNGPHFGGNIRPNSLHFVRIVRVVDGGTIFVTFFNGAKPERVRLIGVKTPETVRPNSPIQEYGEETSAFTTTMLSNRDVWLQFDVKLRDRHRYLLAYVWTEKPNNLNDEEEVRWQMFNARLILEGYAQTMTIQPNSRYARMFAKFQREARKENRGLWWGH